MGAVIFWIVVGVCAALLVRYFKKPKAPPQPLFPSQMPRPRGYEEPAHRAALSLKTDAKESDMQPDLYADVDHYIRAGDWSRARYALQQVSYGLVGAGANAELKQRHTALMTEFAERDPLYRETMPELRVLIQANPGIMQSDITRGMESDKAEALRYVLYFAAERGDVVRIKKGRSYQLYLPGAAPDSGG